MIEEIRVSPQVAVVDMEWYRDHPPKLDERSMTEVYNAALTLATVVQRALAISTSHIGANKYVITNDYDSVSFYQGVAFALAKVNKALTGWEGPDV